MSEARGRRRQVVTPRAIAIDLGPVLGFLRGRQHRSATSSDRRKVPAKPSSSSARSRRPVPQRPWRGLSRPGRRAPCAPGQYRGARSARARNWSGAPRSARLRLADGSASEDLALFARAAETSVPPPAGHYRIAGRNPNGSRYTGTVSIALHGCGYQTGGSDRALLIGHATRSATTSPRRPVAEHRERRN
jgi:hypothetical protein